MNKMQFTNIVCFGEVLWDMLPDGAEPGGAPMNVAIHLKRQGLESILVSRIGRDDEGVRLRKFLMDAGLDLPFLQEDAELPTSKVLVHLDETKNARYEICEPVAWDTIENSGKLDELATKADIILFGTLASRNRVTRNTLLQMLKQSSATKLLDVNLRPPYDNRTLVESFLQLADFIKLNKDELLQIAGWNGRSGTEYELISWLAKQYNCHTVCVTRGADGSILYRDNRMVEHAGFRVNAVDTVGAGDAFLAGLIAGLAKGYSPEKALEYASATGALVASRSGAVPSYTQEEIESILVT